MSGTRYIPGDQDAEIREAYRQGVTLDQIAARTGIPAEELVRLLGLQSQPVSVTQPDDYLWSTDRLDGVL